MKFAINREKFLAGLQKTQSVVPQKTTMPILSNLLVRAVDEGIEIIATDLEIGIKVIVDAVVEEKGDIAVNARKLHEIVKSISGEDCLCSASEEHLRITSGKAKFDMVGMAGEDYPLLPSYSEDTFSSVDTQAFVDMLRKTFFSIPIDEVRYNISGLYIEKDGNTTAFVSTDGHRLSIAKAGVAIPLSFLKEGEGVIVPKKGVNEVIKLLSREGGLVKVGLAQNGNSIVFIAGDTALTVRLIEGKFVNYKQVIPKEHDKSIKANRIKLLSALRRVSILSETVKDDRKIINKVKLNLSHNNILISGKTEIGEAEEDVEVEYGKENLEIMCNARYLVEPLNVIEDEEVMLEFRDPISPIVIKPCIDERYLYVVMPMR